jgi:hypothetical protein
MAQSARPYAAILAFFAGQAELERGDYGEAIVYAERARLIATLTPCWSSRRIALSDNISATTGSSMNCAQK